MNLFITGHFRFVWALGVCFTACGMLASNARAELVEYSAGHADLGLAYEGGELDLHIHFGEGSVLDGVTSVADSELNPSDVYIRIDSEKSKLFPGPAPFLGTGASDPIWVLPANNVGGLPFFGVATEELESAVFSDVTFEMTGFSGPGEFASWQGNASPLYWQTIGGIGVDPGDDVFDFGVGVHDHVSYGFSQEGVYNVEVTAKADFVAGGFVTDVETLRFVVGSATAIPEPGSFAALAFGMVVLSVRRRRRSS